MFVMLRSLPWYGSLCSAWLTYTPLGKRIIQGTQPSPETTYRLAGVCTAAGIGFFLWFQGYSAYLPIIDLTSVEITH